MQQQQSRDTAVESTTAAANNNTNEYRRYINKRFTLRNVPLQSDALTYLTEQLKSMSKEQCQKAVDRILDVIAKENGIYIFFLIFSLTI